eukprot:PhM_4_TR5175/c0_g1_i1/m.27064
MSDEQTDSCNSSSTAPAVPPPQIDDNSINAAVPDISSNHSGGSTNSRKPLEAARSEQFQVPEDDFEKPQSSINNKSNNGNNNNNNLNDRATTKHSKGSSLTSYLDSLNTRGGKLLGLLERFHIPLGAITTIAVGVPVIVMLFFAIIYVLSHQSKASDNLWVAHNAPILENVVDILRYLYMECDDTVRYLTANTTDTLNTTKHELAATRLIMDNVVKAYLAAVPGLASSLISSEAIRNTLSLSSSLELERNLVDAGSLHTPQGVLEGYHALSNDFVNIMTIIERETDGDTADGILAARLVSQCKVTRSLVFSQGHIVLASPGPDTYRQLRLKLIEAESMERYMLLAVPLSVRDQYVSTVSEEESALSTAVKNSAVTNATEWDLLNRATLKAIDTVQHSVVYDLTVHADKLGEESAMGEKIAEATIVVVSVLTFFVAVVQWYVSMASNENQREEIKAREQMEKAMHRLLPIGFLDSLGAEVRTLSANDRHVGTHVLVHAQIWNYEALASLGESHLFDAVHSVCDRVFHVVERFDGFIDKYHLDVITCVFEDPTNGLQAALGIQATLAEINFERNGNAKPPIECGISVHSGPVVLGAVGTTNRLETTITSSTVVTLRRIARFQEHCRVKFIVSDSVFRESSPPVTLLCRSLGHIEAANGRSSVQLHEIYNLDPTPLANLKMKLDATLGPLVAPGATLRNIKKALNVASEMCADTRKRLRFDLRDLSVEMRAERAVTAKTSKDVRVFKFDEK